MTILKNKKYLPLLILVLLGGLSWLLLSNPPTADRRMERPEASLSVAVETVARAPHQIWVESYGRVRPRTQSELFSQVSGEVVWVSDEWLAGGFFEAGDELLRIDDRDYRTAVAKAAADLATAREALSEEQARGEQARQDWQRLGQSGEVPERVARIPQLMAAKAALASAEAALQQAKLNLERTRIRAPYAGRVLEKVVDLGQVVTTNTRLGELYAVDTIEVRLPIQSRDLRYLALPERYRYRDAGTSELPAVKLISELMGHEEWLGQVVQTEGAIDEASRQLYVLAQLNDPYGSQAEGRVPLKMGQYVRARIEGQTLADAIVIPNRVIYQGSYVYVVENGTLQRREIEIGWQDEERALIVSGLTAGEQLVMTAIGQVVSGTPVKVNGESSESAAQPQDRVENDA